MKKIVLIFAITTILISGFVFANKNYILNRILQMQISSLCSSATFGKTAYKIENGAVIIAVENILCKRKNGYIKIKRLRIKYKISNLIGLILNGTKPKGSLELNSPDIKIDLNKLSKKAATNSSFTVSAISGGKIVLIFNGKSAVIDNIRTEGNTITASFVYKHHKLSLLYEIDKDIARLDFNRIDLSDFKEMLPVSAPFNLKNMSGRLLYNLHNRHLSVRASFNRLLLSPYIDIHSSFDLFFNFNPDENKNRYRASIYLKNGNSLACNFISDGKRFTLNLTGIVNMALLRRSSKKLLRIFDKYKIDGTASIKKMVVAGRLNRWKAASIYAVGSASNASFRVTANTPLFTGASGNFRLQKGTLYLTKLHGYLGSSSVSESKITIKRLFSNPISDMLLYANLKLDQSSRSFFKRLVIPKNFHYLLNYIDTLSANSVISIRSYRFRPTPFFPFNIAMKNVAITHKILDISTGLLNIARDSDIVKIESEKLYFKSKTYNGKLKLSAQILSENPDQKSLSVKGTIDAKSMSIISKPLQFSYRGKFNLSIDKKLKIDIDGQIGKLVLGSFIWSDVTGNISRQNGQYSGFLHISSNSLALSYRADLKIAHDIIKADINGKLKKGNFRANLSYDIKKDYWLASLHGSNIKLDLANLLGNKNSRSGFGRGTLNIKLDNIYYKKLIFPYITANLIFDKGFITSKNVKIRFLDALINADFTYSIKNSYIKCRFNYTGKNNNLILDTVGLTGQLTAKQIQTTGDFLVYSNRSYSANIRFVAHRGSVKRFPALVKLLSYLNLKTVLTLRLSDISKRGLKYKRIKGGFAIKDGIMITKTPVIFDGELNMVFQGKYNIKQDNINGVLGIKTFALINKIISKIPIVGWILTGKDKSFSIMTFSINGKLNDPLITPIPIKSIGIGVLNIIKRSLTFPFEVVK